MGRRRRTAPVVQYVPYVLDLGQGWEMRAFLVQGAWVKVNLAHSSKKGFSVEHIYPDDADSSWVLAVDVLMRTGLSEDVATAILQFTMTLFDLVEYTSAA